jgi:4-amino-4-deoxy-L-arabinose transferase-like glycosyltransferase
MGLKFSDFLKTNYRTLASWISKNWKVSLCILLILLLTIHSFVFKIRMISVNMPYSCHNDEKYIIEPALNILKTGDFNPHSFRYPSLPIYLAAMSFTVGFLNAAANLELKSTDFIEPSVYPYFKQHGIIWPAKVLFALLSTLSVLFMALLAYKLYRNPFLLFGVPLVISLSFNYFLISYNYLNVDTVGTFFIFLVYLHHGFYLKECSFFHKVLIPGILSGLAVACKYNLVWIIVPSILIILFYTKERRIRKIISLFLIMFVTFILVVPFSVLDFSTFLDWLAHDIYIYKTDDGIHGILPGLPQLVHYLGYLYEDFGFLLCILAIFGIVDLLMKDWKKGLILLSFPLIHLLHLSLYTIQYSRNVLALFGFFSIFAAIGMVRLYQLLYQLFLKLSFPRWGEVMKKSTVVFLLVVALIFPAKAKFEKLLRQKPDSRNMALQWIKNNLEKKSNIIIAMELAMYTEPLKKDYNLFLWEFKNLDRESFYKNVSTVENPIILMPVFRPLYERQLYAKKQASALNKIGESLITKKILGQRKAILNSPRHVIGKDPKILIGTLKNQKRER